MTTEKYVAISPTEPCGMCGYIWQVLRTIYSIPNEKYYIDFSNCIYKSGVDNINTWDHFFHQPDIDFIESIDQVKLVSGTIFSEDNEFIHELIQPNTKETVQKRREEYNDIIKRNLKLKDNIQLKLDNFKKLNFDGNKILGLHIRATDHPHRNDDDKEEIIKEVESRLEDYDKLFVCSDEQEKFLNVKNYFGDKVIFYDALRSSSNKPLHSHPIYNQSGRNNDENYQYKIAEDVILESYLMSTTDFLICTTGSNVNYLSRALNPNLSSITLWKVT